MKIKHFQIAALTGLMAFAGFASADITVYNGQHKEGAKEPLPMHLQKQRALKSP